MTNKAHKYILFDGVCNFCNASINFIIKRDKKGTFLFTPLQSDLGQKLMKQYDINPDKQDSIILIDSKKAYFKSDAALRISKELQGGWKYLRFFLVLPGFIRDFVYDIIARNRYKIFGKKEACMIPTPEERARFVTDLKS